MPPPRRSHTSRYHFNEVGKEGPEGRKAKPLPAGVVRRNEPAPTKFPFRATINGEEVVVWPDWIEREENDP